MTELRAKLNKLDDQNLQNNQSNDTLYEILGEMITELEKIQEKLKIIESKLN